MTAQRAVTCLTFHDIAAAPVAATRHLSATTTPDAFAAQLDYLQRQYTVIDLDRLLSGDIPDRAAMITFDDAYASIAQIAAPALKARKLPSILFVNPAPVLHRSVPLDALASLVCETNGAATLATIGSAGTFNATTFGAFMDGYVGGLGLGAHDEVKTRLLRALATSEADLHQRLGLFMSADALKRLPAMGMEVANHTLSHVHCGALNRTDLTREIVDARDLIAEVTGKPVRAFAFPWGRQHDATKTAMEVIRGSGHRATFLVHGRPNLQRPARDVWYRVMMRNETGARLRLSLSALPRLREWRARWSQPDAPMQEPRTVS